MVPLDPRRLLTFREVARRRSFSRAAEALALTQPAVSQQVAALERHLGTRLLHRGPGGPTLTAQGELLLAHADALADRLALAGAQLAELAEATRRNLRIGAFPSALATLVPAALARLRTAEPELAFDVEEGTSEELAAGVRDGRFHLAVLFQDITIDRREHPGARRTDLADEPMDAVVALDHPLARRRSIPLDALAGEVWMAPSGSGILVRACRAAGFEPDLRYVSRDPLANGALVAAGLAVTVSPRLLASKLDGVAFVPLTEPPRRSIYALTPDAGSPPAVQTLLEELGAAARAAARATRGPARSRP